MRAGALGRCAAPEITPVGVAGQALDLRPVSREALSADALEVAPFLLNKVIVNGDRAARIVEVEAYRGEDDPASHAYRGRTARNATMFGGAGLLYVYFTYGMHWCANVVCGPERTARAVLLRAGSPVVGLSQMWAARPAARRQEDLCSGPAKLCQALAISRDHDGADLVTGDRGIQLFSDETPPPEFPAKGTRIGVAAGSELPWRFWVHGDPNVSRKVVPAG